MTRLQIMIYQSIILNEHVKGRGFTIEECLDVAKTAFDTDLPKVEIAVGRLIKMGLVDMHFTPENDVILKVKQDG